MSNRDAADMIIPSLVICILVVSSSLSASQRGNCFPINYLYSFIIKSFLHECIIETALGAEMNFLARWHTSHQTRSIKSHLKKYPKLSKHFLWGVISVLRLLSNVEYTNIAECIITSRKCSDEVGWIRVELVRHPTPTTTLMQDVMMPFLSVTPMTEVSVCQGDDVPLRVAFDKTEGEIARAILFKKNKHNDFNLMQKEAGQSPILHNIRVLYLNPTGIILRNAAANDSGTYEVHVVFENNKNAWHIFNVTVSAGKEHISLTFLHVQLTLKALNMRRPIIEYSTYMTNRSNFIHFS